MTQRQRDSKMSLTAPLMTRELESACHVMTRGKLESFLNERFGAGKWAIRDFSRSNDEADGITALSREVLASNAVECGLAELRIQLAEYDARINCGDKR